MVTTNKNKNLVSVINDYQEKIIAQQKEYSELSLKLQIIKKDINDFTNKKNDIFDQYQIFISTYLPKIEVIKKEIFKLDLEVSNKDNYIIGLNDKISKLNSEALIIIKNNKQLNSILLSMENNKNNKEQEINLLSNKIELLSKELDSIELQKKKLEKDIDNIILKIKEKEIELELKQQKIHEFDVEYSDKISDLSVWESSLENKEKQLRSIRVALEKAHGKHIKVII